MPSPVTLLTVTMGAVRPMAMLLHAVCHATNTGFENVVAVEEGHLRCRLDPNLVLRILLGDA
jgi:hypothetical protein